MSSMRFYYDPFSEFDRLFDNAFSTRFWRPNAPSLEGRPEVFRPRMDVHENAETNTITASFELPGLKPEQVNIDVYQDRLTVSGERVHEDVRAKMENGVLNMTFPKAQQAQQPKRITIE